MAIKYGYTGVAPDKLGMYCTDEEVPNLMNPELNAECSRDDATSDPFTWFDKRLGHAVDLLIGSGSDEAPVWTLDDIDTDLSASVLGMGFYASGALEKGPFWTNFFNGGDRPKHEDEVGDYVVGKLTARLCAPANDTAIAAKKSDDARKKAQENLKALRDRVKTMLEPLGFTDEDLACAAPKS